MIPKEKVIISLMITKTLKDTPGKGHHHADDDQNAE
jgi:hypothetical protein